MTDATADDAPGNMDAPTEPVSCRLNVAWRFGMSVETVEQERARELREATRKIQLQQKTPEGRKELRRMIREWEDAHKQAATKASESVTFATKNLKKLRNKRDTAERFLECADEYIGHLESIGDNAKAAEVAQNAKEARKSVEHTSEWIPKLESLLSDSQAVLAHELRTMQVLRNTRISYQSPPPSVGRSRVVGRDSRTSHSSRRPTVTSASATTSDAPAPTDEPPPPAAQAVRASPARCSFCASKLPPSGPSSFDRQFGVRRLRVVYCQDCAERADEQREPKQVGSIAQEVKAGDA